MWSLASQATPLGSCSAPKRPVKPLIYQQRKKAKFVSKTNETDDNVFMSKKFIYGADSRGNAGFGFWQMAYGSDGTTT